MESAQVDNKRITKNAIILYGRMFLTMFISFYASRVILEVLGVEDFGIYNVVWGVTTVVTFFNGSLMNVAQRYLNIGIGRNDLQLTNQYFNQFLFIFTIFAFVIIIIGESLSVWVVEHLLSIPTDRIAASHWVYKFSLITLALTLIRIPYQAAVIANEKMNAFAYVTLFESISRLVILYLIKILHGDNLIWYAAFLTMISLAAFIYYVVYCICHFKECKLKYYFDFKLAKEMSSFVGYNVYGCFAFSMCQQGVNVLLNIFFGPVVNAARAITMQVYQGIYHFADNILVAVRPPVIKLYSQGDYLRMIKLSVNTTRYCLYINTLLVLPIVSNIDFILKIWLKNVPDYTALFIQIILIESYFNIMNQMITILVNATGKLKRNQFYGRTYTLAVLPLAYLMLLIIREPVIPIIMIVIGTILYFLNNLYDIHLQLKVNIADYIKEVVWPIVTINVIIGGILFIISYMFSQSWLSLVVSCIVDLVLGFTLIYKFLLSQQEQTYFNSKLKKIIKLNRR